MAEIKPNSDAFKNRNKDAEKAEEKKTTGKVQIKEKSFKQKCKEAIIADDVGDLKEYAIIKVLIPAAKKTIRNLLVNMFDIRFFGKSMGSDRSDDRGSRIVSYQTKSYDIYDDEYDRPRRREGRHRDSSGSTLRIDELSNVQFTSEEDALNVLRYLRGAIVDYQVVSVADFLERADLTANPTHRNWGWYSLDTAAVKYDSDSELYYISFPRPKDIR